MNRESRPGRNAEYWASDERIRKDYGSPYPEVSYTRVIFRVDKATGDVITHFKINQMHDWTPAPGWEHNRPHMELMNVELWNRADVTAKYAMLLLKTYAPNIKLMMSQQRKYKWLDGVEIVASSLKRTDGLGEITIATEKTDREIEQLLFNFLEDHPMLVTDNQEQKQLDLFDVPLLLAPAY